MKIFRLFVVFTLICFALSPSAQAVVPAPDGGYPGGNTAEGQKALQSLTTGGFNAAVGYFSLFANTTGSQNTATGAGALLFNSTGADNTASGAFALFYNTHGQNSAFGSQALFSNTGGGFNTAMGYQALFSNAGGGFNTAMGYQALINADGGSNTAIGAVAGTLITGDYNICIGAFVDGVVGENNTIRIGDNLPTGNGQSACYIGGIAGQTVNPSGAGTVYIDNSGKLGVFASSQRFKRDIKPMDKDSEAILALKPVTFHYKSDAKNTPCFGLIAEEVAQINPDLVVRDQNGEIVSVRYEQVNAMLLNEFLKEHRTVQELKSVVAKQEATNAKQQKQIEALTAGLQKVSAQLELSKAAPQTVLNTR